MEEVVIVDACRTPITRAKRGALAKTTPDQLLATVLRATLHRTKLEPSRVDDVVVGNVQQAGAYAGPARMAALRAGIPASTPVYALNRQCSSGLQAVANAAAAIREGSIRCAIAAGVESMSAAGGGVTGAELPPANWDEISSHPVARDCLIPMGQTAEIVAERYGVGRREQDEMAVASHAKALAAQAAGHFDAELVPVRAAAAEGEECGGGALVTADEGPRPGTTLEVLGRLRTVFKPDGTVTAGTSSQVSDGASAVLLASRSLADELGLRPLGTLLSYRVIGVPPDEMGVGPAVAIPAALEAAGLTLGDVDIFEINEAFAAQAAYCVRKLGIPADKLNPLGGAIALGHPLGCTGARQVATLLHALRRKRKRVGVVSMCVGTGMGAAAVFRAEQ